MVDKGKQDDLGDLPPRTPPPPLPAELRNGAEDAAVANEDQQVPGSGGGDGDDEDHLITAAGGGTDRVGSEVAPPPPPSGPGTSSSPGRSAGITLASEEVSVDSDTEDLEEVVDPIVAASPPSPQSRPAPRAAPHQGGPRRPRPPQHHHHHHLEPSGTLPVDVDMVVVEGHHQVEEQRTSSGRSSEASQQPRRSSSSSPPTPIIRATTKEPSSSRAVSRRRRTLVTTADPGIDWQIRKPTLAARGGHLLETGTWSDCQFIVGIPPNVRVFKSHQMLLAMASPVFEAMFYGDLASATNADVKILDVQPDAFYVMLQYIYTDSIRLTSFELVCDICYAARKYMLPALVDECTKFLWRDLYPRNACRAYEIARLFEEPVLMEKGLQIIRTQTKEIIGEPTFADVEHSTLCMILSQDSINVDEATLFEAMVKWAGKECERQGVEATGESKRTVLSGALFLIRYLTFQPADFAAGPAKSGLLTQEESFAVLMNISAPGSWELPDHLSKEAEPRRAAAAPQPPQEGPLSASGEEGSSSTRCWCNRAIMPEQPPCLNTSILDCSVTFMVDKDVCIHGIEVPSQVSLSSGGGGDPGGHQQQDQQQAVEGSGNSVKYNELLYAHLLDNEGNRLTYTHFTAKVARNSVIEIAFNRPVYIKAGKVYRVGMVLNKVGWYPMGVCTRRVNHDGVYFTFCVGQPTDSLRDGLIRSIIFSK